MFFIDVEYDRWSNKPQLLRVEVYDDQTEEMTIFNNELEYTVTKYCRDYYHVGAYGYTENTSSLSIIRYGLQELIGTEPVVFLNAKVANILEELSGCFLVPTCLVNQFDSMYFMDNYNYLLEVAWKQLTLKDCFFLDGMDYDTSLSVTQNMCNLYNNRPFRLVPEKAYDKFPLDMLRLVCNALSDKAFGWYNFNNSFNIIKADTDEDFDYYIYPFNNFKVKVYKTGTFLDRNKNTLSRVATRIDYVDEFGNKTRLVDCDLTLKHVKSVFVADKLPEGISRYFDTIQQRND